MSVKQKQTNRSPSPVDIAIGKTLRSLRLAAGKSQEEVGKAVGVSFQQIQKAEKGSNRISAGRLVELADAIGCHPTDFFVNLCDGVPGEVWNQFDTLGDVRVLKVFQLIACPDQKAKILALMETLAGVDD
jgi:transcriptional regulator with XRE-family HTH domain